jgi:hypothetical protein
MLSQCSRISLPGRGFSSHVQGVEFSFSIFSHLPRSHRAVHRSPSLRRCRLLLLGRNGSLRSHRFIQRSEFRFLDCVVLISLI